MTGSASDDAATALELPSIELRGEGEGGDFLRLTPSFDLRVDFDEQGRLSRSWREWLPVTVEIRADAFYGNHIDSRRGDFLYDIAGFLRELKALRQGESREIAIPLEETEARIVDGHHEPRGGMLLEARVRGSRTPAEWPHPAELPRQLLLEEVGGFIDLRVAFRLLDATYLGEPLGKLVELIDRLDEVTTS